MIEHDNMLAPPAGFGFIYALVDLSNPDVIRYIGKTETSLISRFWGHVRDANNLEVKSHRSNWMRKVARNGGRVAPVLLETVPVDMLPAAEKRWITWGRNTGLRLTNGTEGGEGGKPTQATRAKLSSSQKKAQADPRIRKRKSETMKAVCSNPIVKERRSIALRAALARPEVKENHRKAAQYNNNRPEVKAKMSVSVTAALNRPEVRQLLSQTIRAAKARPEVKAREREVSVERNAARQGMTAAQLVARDWIITSYYMSGGITRHALADAMDLSVKQVKDALWRCRHRRMFEGEI